MRAVCTYAGTAKIVASLLMIAIASAIPFSIISFTEEAIFYDGTKVEVCRTHIFLPWQRMYIIFTIVIFYGLPLVTLLLVYIVICHKMALQSGNPQLKNNMQSSVSMRLRKQVILMLVIVTMLFFICLLPFKVLSIWVIYASKEEIQRLGLEGYLALLNFSRIMYYINSAVNPIVYNLVSTRFRSYFKYSVTCGRIPAPSAFSRTSTFSVSGHSRMSSRKGSRTMMTYYEGNESSGYMELKQTNGILKSLTIAEEEEQLNPQKYN